MQKKWWVWLFGPAVASTALLVAVAVFAREEDEGAPAGAVATTSRDEVRERALAPTTAPTQTTRAATRTGASETATTPTRATPTNAARPPARVTTLTLTRVTTTSPTPPPTNVTPTTTTPPTTPRASIGPRTTTRPSATATRKGTITAGRASTATVPRRTTTTDATAPPPASRATRTTRRERKARLGRVPDLLGLTPGQALKELAEAGFRVRVRREQSFFLEGTVFEQRPRPGKRIRKGKTVVVTVSSSRPQRRPPQPPPPAPVSAMPRVLGLDYWEAAARMELRGMIANSYPVRSRRRLTNVVDQAPAPGTRIQRGSRVRLTVSVGRRARRPLEIPQTVGLKELTGHLRCRDAHFTCRTVLVGGDDPGAEGRVVRQVPLAGQLRPELAQMTLYVGRSD